MCPARTEKLMSRRTTLSSKASETRSNSTAWTCAPDRRIRDRDREPPDAPSPRPADTQATLTWGSSLKGRRRASAGRPAADISA